jgi:hypothetical protein
MPKDQFLQMRYFPVISQVQSLRKAIADRANAADVQAYIDQLQVREGQLAEWDSLLGSQGNSDSIIRATNLMMRDDPAAAAFGAGVNSLAVRGTGGIQFGFGLAQAAGSGYVIFQTTALSGGTLSWAAWAGAGWMVLNGLDNAWAGGQQFATGETTTTVTQSALNSAGLGVSVERSSKSPD